MCNACYELGTLELIFILDLFIFTSLNIKLSFIFITDDIVYNQSMVNGNTMDKRRPDLRDELGYIAPPNRKLPPVPGSNYNTCDRVKRGSFSLEILRVFLILLKLVDYFYVSFCNFYLFISLYHVICICTLKKFPFLNSFSWLISFHNSIILFYFYLTTNKFVF